MVCVSLPPPQNQRELVHSSVFPSVSLTLFILSSSSSSSTVVLGHIPGTDCYRDVGLYLEVNSIYLTAYKAKELLKNFFLKKKHPSNIIPWNSVSVLVVTFVLCVLWLWNPPQTAVNIQMSVVELKKKTLFHRSQHEWGFTKQHFYHSCTLNSLLFSPFPWPGSALQIYDICFLW